MPENSLIPIPLPLRGLNTIEPNRPIGEGYARELTNMMLQNGQLRMRPAVRTAYENDPAMLQKIDWYDFSTGTPWAIRSNGVINRMDTWTTPGSIAGYSGPFPLYNIKHGSLDLLIGCMAPRDAAYPFTTWTFTTGTITATAITSAVSHRSRLYVCDGSTIEFSTVDAVTGAMAGSFPIGALLEGQTVVRMVSATTIPGDGSRNVLVIFGSGGKVLVYDGDYPASSTWNLIGNHNMAAPATSACFAEVRGDWWIATGSYAYWLSDVLRNGAAFAYENRPTLPIDNIWRNCTWEWPVGNPENSHCFYVGGDLDIVVSQCFQYQSLVNTSDYQNEGAYFVYSPRYKAWSFWMMPPFFYPVRSFGGTAYGATYGTEVCTLSLTHAVDSTTGGALDIETSWKTPYFQPAPGRGCKVNGVRPFFKNTISGYLHKIRSTFDYSDYNAPSGWWTQSSVTDIPPGSYKDAQADGTANTWQHYNPKISLGGDGGLVSFQVSQKRKDGSSETQEQVIYGLTASVEVMGESYG